MTKKKTETVVVTWRIKEALRRRLEAAAARNEVSVNNEITRRIEESFTRGELASLAENVDRLSYYVANLDMAQHFEREAARTEGDEELRASLLRMAAEARRLAEKERRSEPEPPPPRSDFPQVMRRRARGQPTEQGLRATAEGYRRNAERHEARGAYDKAAQMRETADKLERDAMALTQRQAPVSDQEPELPMPRADFPPTTAQSLAGSLLKAVESGELSISEAFERLGDARREYLARSRTGQPPDEKPEPLMPRMPRRESSK